MKIFVVVLAVLAVSTYAQAATMRLALPKEDHEEHVVPLRLTDVDTDGGVVVHAGSPIVRQRRFTCDVFSFESSVATPNHAACALKCVGQGRKGGHCEGTTCVCRDDKWIG